MKKWRIALVSVVALVAIAVVASAAFLSSNASRKWVIHRVAANTHRRIQVDGPFELHLLSSRPSLVAERVTISNPPWMPPGTAARIGKLSVSWDFPLPVRQSSIRRLEISDATLHLVRDAEGRTNWQWKPPGAPRHGPGHLVRSLSMPGAQVVLDDARRHLKFNGTVTAREIPGDGAAPSLRIEGAGQLNGEPATFAINGDPLATASRDRPYRFTYEQRSRRARLTGRGALPQPFNIGVLDTTFEASGASMNDLYSLVGMHFPNSAPFKLTGELARRREHSTFTGLAAHFGESDFSGTVALRTVDRRIRFDADLHSKRLRLADLGRHEADGSPRPVPPSKFLLPDTPIPLNALRNRLGSVHYRAATVVSQALSVQDFESTASIDDGVLKMPSLTARYQDGKVSGSVQVDASTDSPKTDLDLRIAGLPLDHFFRKAASQPPLEGSLHARVQITGRGSSLHQIASTADGALAAVLPRGSMRASLAELTGGNLRGLGLQLAEDQRETGVRCAVASFGAQQGKLITQHLMIDTVPVSITGSGVIDLSTEALDLTLHGRSKKLRLARVRSPVYVRGSLGHPSFSLDKGHIAAQTTSAAALGIALTPLAAVLALVDPGLAKDADCSELHENERAGRPDAPHVRRRGS
jgi:AsmA family protein